MIIYDRRSAQYSIFCFIYFYLTIIYIALAREGIGQNLSWLSDKFFVFQYATVYLIGSSKIIAYFNYPAISRYTTRRQIVLDMYLLHIIWSFVLLLSLFIPIIILNIIVQNRVGNTLFIATFDKAIRFMLGSLLLSNISIFLKFSVYNIKNLNAGLINFIILVLDSFIISPQLKKLFNHNVYIIYAWIFGTELSMAIVALVTLNISLFFGVIMICRKSDLYN